MESWFVTTKSFENNSPRLGSIAKPKVAVDKLFHQIQYAKGHLFGAWTRAYVKIDFDKRRPGVILNLPKFGWQS